MYQFTCPKCKQTKDLVGEPRGKHCNGCKETRPIKYGFIENGYKVWSFKGKKRKEHRMIMEQILGRPLKRQEVVHHINENKLDNRPENLELFANNAEHMKHHMTTDVAKARSKMGHFARWGKK